MQISSKQLSTLLECAAPDSVVELQDTGSDTIEAHFGVAQDRKFGARMGGTSDETPWIAHIERDGKVKDTGPLV